MYKILFFIEKFGRGGAEIVLRNLVDRMDQAQFDITVQSVWPYEEGKQLVPGVKYKSVYPRRNKFTEKLYRAEAAAGLTYPLHIKDDYDIECAYLEAGPTKIIASSTNRRAKKLAWVHCDLLNAYDDIASFAEKTAPWYASYDHIVCVSETVKQSFDTIFSNRFSSVVLYNVVDDKAIRELAEKPCPALSDRLVVLASGSIYPPKNYPRMISAHKRILAEGYDHELWILGDGIDRELIERMITEQDVENSVHLFGFQDNPYPYMKRADILACSSNYEGFSTVITEGIILNKAIVTTECSGMREILGDSEYGLIVDNDDEAFYKGLKKMVVDKELCAYYSRKAEQRAQVFSCIQRVKETEMFLQQLVMNE